MKKKLRISDSFQRSLLVLVVIALILTVSFSWLLQTKLTKENAYSVLTVNLADVQKDIEDASDEKLLSLADKIAADIDSQEEITSDFLFDLTEKYHVTEINCVDKNGFIYATTYPDFMGYDMSSGEQSSEFMVLLDGAAEYVQPYQPVSYDKNISRKYGGVVLENGGFVQVGYSFDRFQEDISEFINGVTQNRHVGENGCIIIDENNTIVSDRHGNEGEPVTVTGISLDELPENSDGFFVEDIYGIPSYCKYVKTEGYTLISVLPVNEAAMSRNVAVGTTSGMLIMIFAALFVLIFILVKKLVVDKIHTINHSLAKITDGHLDTVVDVNSHEEFESLSNDINATVNTLKKYIADAEARIDAELAFAKAIQYSALPSVFPPYPNRDEFEIWATMHTAKEVGGDFYNFYFIDDDTLAFLIADVSGKGIPAAMFMMESKTLLKSYAEAGMDVNEVLINANNKLCENNDTNMFVTAWMGFFNTRTGLLTYANAGHNRPLIRHSNNSFEYLKSRPGLVLGGMEDIPYRKYEIQLAPGDIIYLYTDGVTEANDSAETLYGEERLLNVMNSVQDAGTRTICESVKLDIDSFVGEAAQFDDITMLCLKYNSSPDTTNEE